MIVIRISEVFLLKKNVHDFSKSCNLHFEAFFYFVLVKIDHFGTKKASAATIYEKKKFYHFLNRPSSWLDKRIKKFSMQKQISVRLLNGVNLNSLNRTLILFISNSKKNFLYQNFIF